MQLRATIKGDQAIIRALQKAPRQTGEEIRRDIDFITTDIANTAKQDHPYIDRTGNLTNSIGIVPAKEVVGGYEGVAQAVMDYAEDVEGGTEHSRAFPFMGPAKEDKYPDSEIERRIATAAMRGLRRAGL